MSNFPPVNLLIKHIMNLRLPLSLRRALLTAMCAFGCQAFATEYTASNLEEFKTAWSQLADGDTITVTSAIDFQGTELSALAPNAGITVKSDGHGSIINFNYPDMSAVSMQNVNVQGDGTVRVGSMTDGMLSGTGEDGAVLSIENGSTVDDTWLMMEENKLVAGDNVVLNRNDVTTGKSTTIETRTDPETGAVISTVVTKTPGETAMELGNNVQINEMDMRMNDGVRGKIVSRGDILLTDSILVSTGAVNTTTLYAGDEESEIVGRAESVGAQGGIDLSAGSVLMADTSLSTLGDGDQFTGGDILLGDNSILEAADREEITTGALVLTSGLEVMDKDGQYLPGTGMEESMGLYGDIFIGDNSSVDNYDLDAKGSIFIGSGAELTSVTLDAVSVELDSVYISEGDNDTRTVRMTTKVGDQASVVIGSNSTLDDVDIYAEGGDIYIGDHTVITGDNDLSGGQMADIWAGDTVGSINDQGESTRGTISFDGVLKQNADGDYVLASGTYSEGTYGGNVVIGNGVTLTMTTVAAENTITLGNDVTYQGTEDESVYHMSAFSDADNSLVQATIIDTDEDGNILNGTVSVTERENKITTGRNNMFTNSKAPGRSAAMDISRGGALYAHGDIVIGEGNHLIGNTAAGSGGAVFAQNNITRETTYVNGERSAVLTTEVLDIAVGNGSVFSGNRAGANGGAIASELTTNLNLRDGDDANSLFDNEGANIWIGRDVTFTDNTAGGLGGAIHLMEDRLLAIDSGAFFNGNYAGGEANDIFAEDGSTIVVNVNQDDFTLINSGISDADYYSLDDGPWIRGSANLVQMGGGELVYGGRDTEDNGFGGEFLQESGAGSLVIGHLVETDDGFSMEGAQMGIDDLTDYEINGKGIILAADSTLAGDTLTLNGNAVIQVGEGSSLLLNEITFNGASSVRLWNMDEAGRGQDLTHTASGVSSVDNVTVTGIDAGALPLYNSAFVSTNAVLHEDGTIKLTQRMKGVASPMQGYAGNVSGTAAGMEQARLGVKDGSAAHRFFENLLGTSSADQAAAMIQSVSGETVVNAAWASNDALKGFAALGRTQGSISAARSQKTVSVKPVQSVDAKGSPIAMAPVASGRGSVWVGGLGSWTDQNRRGGIDGYKYDAGGYAVGADYSFSTSSLAGIAIGQTYGTFQDKGGLSSYDADSFMAMVYGRYTPARAGKLALDGYAAFGTTSFDGKARMADTSARGEFDADSFGAAVYATWTEELRSKLVIAPFAGLEFMTGKTDSFSEHGDLARTFSGARAQNWTLPVGVTLSRTYAVGAKTTLTPAITVAVAQDLCRMNPKGSVSSDLGAWTARGVNMGRTALRVNAGVSAAFGSNWGARIGYSLESRAGLTAQGINGSVSYSF